MNDSLLKFSKRIIKKHGSNYYRAALLFPSEIRKATFLYYAWVRTPDELVDSGLDKSVAKEEIYQWLKDWSVAKEEMGEGDTIHHAMYSVFEKNKTPMEYAESFLEVMVSDLENTHFETYEDLRKYMYGSAAVVGLTMLTFFDVRDKNLVPGAIALAEAMQLTNFLRDIKEDVDDLGRIYLPQEDMQKFGVLNEDIAAHRHTDSFKSLMRFEIQRCRKLYRDADFSIKKLPVKVRIPVQIAARNYEGILDEIEDADYDIWQKRHGLSRFKKIVIIIKSIFV
jgi:phytoene synthase